MSVPAHFNGHSRRPSLARQTSPKSKGRMSADLIVMAALIGISRAILGRQKQGPIKRALSGLSTAMVTHASGRGREAENPADIPAKGWKDIAWRVYENIQNDRVLLVSAGVTYYGLLALFPATAAMVSLYGLFADASSINEHLRLVSGFLPEGALQVLGDQVKRITSKGQATLGFTLIGTLALSLWGANAGTKAIFDALNIIYKEREKRGFFRLTLYSLAFTIGAIAIALVSLAGIIAVPLALKIFGHSGTLRCRPADAAALAGALSHHSVRAGMPLSVRTQPKAPTVALGDMGQCHRGGYVDYRIALALMVRLEFRNL